VTASRAARATLATLVIGGALAPGAVRAGAADAHRAAVAPRSRAPSTAVATQAPSSPPLLSGGLATGAGAGGTEDATGSPQGETDPLVSNGLGSPLCKGVLGAGEIPASAARHCETSGFVAAPAPTGNYGIDVHIDTGVLGLSSGELLSVVQDLVITPLWMALVWAVHALVVTLEWSFSIDLLDSSAASGIGRGLRQMQAAFTQPWLALVLAIASVLALYNGLIRRRVGETVGQVLLTGTMMVGGMWVIADPTGTVGVLGGWTNRASLGTLAVAARGSPAGPGTALASSLEEVFAAAIEVPWCYLEFGDVGWCRDPARLDPRVHAAGLKIAAEETSLIGCKLGPQAPTPCTTPGSAQAETLEHSAELLRAARSNGAVFLALPANGPARNSINEQGSLLRTICGSSEATSCRGPTAAEAEFRTNGGTWWRLGGLMLIAAGVLGMGLLLGFIALRLLAAAIFSLLYLLLAPAMVLAPALGEGGRAVFRRWAAQLLAAVVSKLLFSFLLGAVLAVLAILSELEALGWWTQWLMMSAFWWGAYARRHQALEVAGGVVGREHHGGGRSIVRRVGDALESPRKAVGAARWTMSRLGGSAPGVERRGPRMRATTGRARRTRDEQAARVLEHERRDARIRMQTAPRIERQLAAERARLERIDRERAIALSAGDTRRALELGDRRARVADELEREQGALNATRHLAADDTHAWRGAGSARTVEQAHDRALFLDEQAGLPGAGTPSRRAAGREDLRRRDYAALAGLAGLARREYEQLDPPARRAVRLEVDRELTLRRELGETARVPGAHSAGPQPDRARSSSHGERPRAAARPARVHGSGPESSIMRDAREVAARRKRQLGPDRP